MEQKSTEQGKRRTFYMTARIQNMLDKIMEHTGENASQVLTALIIQEFYKLKLHEKIEVKDE
jgi:hypothetical protein